MFSELPRKEEARRLSALLLIEGISRKETTCPQVARDEVLNYGKNMRAGSIQCLFCFFFSAKKRNMLEYNSKHL